MIFGNCAKIWQSKIELGSITAITSGTAELNAGESPSHLSVGIAYR